jgi:fructan beta-fructosidase
MTWRSLAALAVVCMANTVPVPPRPADPQRPQRHFTPPSAWMNDPNGLVHVGGWYHLFYQHNPDATVWGPMHWGHAVSRDLVHWQDRPIALAPDALGTIFSGSVVVDRKNRSGLSPDTRVPLIALFTYHDEAARAGGGLPQSQGLAYSLDQGETWTKYAGNPVLRPAAGQVDFRDPKLVWYAPARRWIMVLAVGHHVEFYASRNLRQWTQAGQFAPPEPPDGGVWECPDLFPIRDARGVRHWVLLHSLIHGGPNGGTATRYWIGQFDGHRFVPDAGEQAPPRWFDWGRDNYAGVTFADAPGGDRHPLLIGWMTNWNYADKTPTQGWRGSMTIARRLSLRRLDDGSSVLVQQPVDDPLPPAPRARPFVLTGTRDVPTGDGAPTRVRLAFASTGSVTIELANAAGETYRFGYDAAQDRFVSDRTRSGQVDFAPDFASVDHAPRLVHTPTVTIDLVIDRHSVEAFADQGASVMTTAVFPRAPYTRVRLIADDAPVQVTKLTVNPRPAR